MPRKITAISNPERSGKSCGEKRLGLISGLRIIATGMALALPVGLLTAAQEFRVVQVTAGLNGPWGMAFLPDGSLLITEKQGRIKRFEGGQLQQTIPVSGVRVEGQGGLLDVALHPDYANNGLIYLSMSAAYSGGIGTQLIRGRINAQSQFVDTEVIYRMPAPGSGGSHFGSRVGFDADGYVYLTIGDRGQAPRAQDLSRAEGKLMRLHDDGRIPEDNPYVGTPGVLEEIFSYGHRNAQGLYFDPVEHQLWLHEHGPQGGDALHRIQAGANYGWPIASYGAQYGSGQPIGVFPHELDHVENPYTYWGPTSIAPSGLTLYRGGVLPWWNGDLFLGALGQRHIHRVVPGEGAPALREELIRNTYGRIRAVVTGPDELLYFVTDGNPAALYRIEPVRTSWWFSIPPKNGWRDSTAAGGRLGALFDAHWPWFKAANAAEDTWFMAAVPTAASPTAVPAAFHALRMTPQAAQWVYVHTETGWLFVYETATWESFPSGDPLQKSDPVIREGY